MAQQPRGYCALCEHQTTKAAMGKHLAACPQRQEQPGASKPGRTQSLVHLRMQDDLDNRYWLDVEVQATATLEEIDTYLRAIWLECCGHLSTFFRGGWGDPELDFQERVDAVFGTDDELTHIYDFGTESVTRIAARGRRKGVPLTSPPIVLMARNLAPDLPCVECDQSASHLCPECQIEWDSPGTLCATHVDSHPHEDYGDPIAVVNSPRLGLCGYEGPAEPPY